MSVQMSLSYKELVWLMLGSPQVTQNSLQCGAEVCKKQQLAEGGYRMAVVAGSLIAKAKQLMCCKRGKWS